MLFNSIEFPIFLTLAFLLYWFVLDNHRNWQNLFLLVISYIFYGWWDWRYLGLIAVSSLVDYVVGKSIIKFNYALHKKLLLALSLSVNLGLLAIFKYFNFFI